MKLEEDTKKAIRARKSPINNEPLKKAHLSEDNGKDAKEGSVEKELEKGEALKMTEVVKEVVNDDKEIHTEDENEKIGEENRYLEEVEEKGTAVVKEVGNDVQEKTERSLDNDSDPDFTGYTEEELQGVKRINVVSAPTSPTDYSLQSDVGSSTPQLPRRSNSIGERPPRLPPRNTQKSSLNKNEVVKIGNGSPSRKKFRKSVEEMKSKALKKISKK